MLRVLRTSEVELHLRTDESRRHETIGWSHVFSFAGVAGLSGVNVPLYEVTASELSTL
jgi:hypothetical protein